MPKQHGKHSRHAEYQGKGEKVPLFPEKIYIRVPKKFHSIKTPFSIRKVSKFQGFKDEQTRFGGTAAFPTLKL
jgi:hypothetical protein